MTYTLIYKTQKGKNQLASFDNVTIIPHKGELVFLESVLPYFVDAVYHNHKTPTHTEIICLVSQ